MAAAPVAGQAAPAGPPRCGPTFTDQLTALPWPLQRLDPEAAWPTSRGRGVVVAVIDSGVTRRHPKLSGRVVAGKDFVQAGGSGDCDADGHGTLVAGIIAGNDTRDVPFYGIAPDAYIMPVRVLPNSKRSTDPTLPRRIADALVWAVNNGADVVNMSLVTEPTPALESAVKYAVSKNVVVVAAAGNEGASPSAGQPVYPAAYPEVIAVAGIDQQGKHVASSNTGEYVDIAAPGYAIEGPAPQGGGYAIDQEGGTSFAAAYVSGVAALIREHSPSLSPSDIRRRLQLTADAPAGDRDDQVGFGVVNPYRAVATILESENKRDDTTAGQVPAALPPDARLDTVRAIGGWVFGGGLLIAVLLLVAGPIRRRARRGTRPAALPDLPAPAASRFDSYTPVFGEPVRITSPSVRRQPEQGGFTLPGFDERGGRRTRG
ncbi:type VII secretion-associated serine protease [Actinoplanes philippinensis]|nr:type VII secretion-associated serine protease [Actinoplanes philippinensis]